tara:strand:- start:229 stop:996 length:768 start_codon:yes stop_codon:yes gene_type:complete
MEPSIQVSVLIPLHNEQDILLGNVEYLAGEFDKIFGQLAWHFVLVDNASSDNTPEVIQEILKRWPNSVSEYEPSLNYGKALKTGMKRASAPWVHSIDIEQWDIPFVRWAWKNRDLYDLFIASKRADPTLNRQAPYRRFLSWGLNALINLMLGYSGTETHGPKLLRMEKVRPIINICQMSRGQFDVELVVRAFRKGFRIIEIPVEYAEQRASKNLMFLKILWNVKEFIRLNRLLVDYPYEGSVNLYRISRRDVLEE